MSTAPSPKDDARLAEQALHVATRFIALVRTGYSYAIGHPSVTTQLEQTILSLQALQPAGAPGAVELGERDGKLCVNGAPLPVRSTHKRQLEQLRQELADRGVAAVRFSAPLTAAELGAFLRLFLDAKTAPGAALVAACEAQGLRHVAVIAIGTAMARAAGGAGEVAAPGAAPATDRRGAPPEYMQAMRAYGQALADARLLLAHGTLPAGVQMRHAKRVVMPLVDAALAGQPLNAALAQVRRAPAPACEHAVHVALLAIAIGERLGCPRRVLAELGVAALLHDIGHAPEDDAAPGTPHALAGMRRIARGAPFDRTTLFAMQAALAHHAEADAVEIAAVPAARHVRMVAIADAYVTLLGAHGPRTLAWTPYETLGRILGPLAERFEAPLLGALVEALGVHPPGQRIRLDDGSIARVAANTPGLPDDPYLELLTETSGRPLPEERRGVIALLPPGRAVLRALPLKDWPGDARAA